MPVPNSLPQRTEQRQLARQHSRLRTQLLAAWRQLAQLPESRTRDQPRRVEHLIRAAVELWKRRGSRHLEIFLGPAALAGVGRQSRSSDKRAKPEVLDVWLDREGRRREGLGLLRRTHRGGGRLASKDGGGKNSRGRFRGNADGFMPGPEITGWGRDEYHAVKLGPPPSPAPGSGRRPDEDEQTHRDRVRRDQALAQRGLQMSEGP